MRQSLRLVSGLYLKLSLLTIAVGFLLRIVLLFNEQTTDLGFSFGEWLQVFLLGAVNDLCAATIGFAFLWLFSMSVSETKYGKPWGYIILGILVAAFCYVTFCNTIFDEYGSVAPQIASAVLGYWAGTFALRLFFKGFRSYWTTVWFALIITLYVGAILFNGLSEYFFWSEFGVRYNFIAVDYLVYTNEVVGNIMESYPIVPMTLGLILVTLVVTWYLFRRDLALADQLKGWRWKAVAGPAYIAAVLLAVWLLELQHPVSGQPERLCKRAAGQRSSTNSTTHSSRTNSTTSNSTSPNPKSRPKPSSMGFTAARATTCTPYAAKDPKSAAISC